MELSISAESLRWRNFFAGSRVAEITTPRIREFIAQRQLRAVPNATINRSLALLRRMFRLAFQDASLRVVPHFPMLKENNVREGVCRPRSIHPAA